MKTTICFLSAFLLMLLAGCNETTTSRYSNYQEAKKSGVFNREWIPDVLPMDTGEIAETHDLDTNNRCAEALIPVDSIPQIEVNLKEKGFDEFDSELPALPSFNSSSADCTFGLTP